MLKILLKKILITLYKIEIKGLENYQKAGNRVLIIANHLSFLDAILLAVFLPDKPLFAVNTFIAKKWWMKPFLKIAKTFSLDPTNPMAVKSLINEIKKDQKCVIFPEGRITVTGSLMKIYEGPGMIADKSDAMILPVRLDGAQFSPFSRLRGRVKIHLFPKITITILPPQKFEVAKDITGKNRRSANADKLYDIMTEMLFESSDYKKTLFSSLLDARKIHGRNHQIIVDVERKPLSYNQLITRSFILGKEISKETKEGEYVGLMLPNVNSAIVTFFGMQAFGRVPAMINFSTGGANFIAACKVAKLKAIFTSKKFVEGAKLEKLIQAATSENIRIIYLEELAKRIGLFAKICGIFKAQFAKRFYSKTSHSDADDAAVILFTSGSEGTPKGVVLSHKNIQANRFQLSSRVDFSSRDIVFNALPIFHSFGLTGGTILPILSGIKTFFYPSPLHYRIVPELAYDVNATIMFGTNTFLSNYARFANAYDFYSVRYVFAGAEKLEEETRKTWSEKFGVRIFEGYGATETAPALSTNTPMHNKPGTVGRLAPGIKFKLEEISGIEDGKKLLVTGPNIMKGYLLEKNPGVITRPQDGWYDTGDIVAIDEKGYIAIKGRAKRFAKIAGEMVSLTATETNISKLDPKNSHAIVAIPDAKKGEQLVLMTTNQSLKRADISAYFKENQITELSVPKEIIVVEKLPLLGTGKIDYVTVKELVTNQSTE
ncbi:MAG: AMP-dependent synthetase and ligase [Rickettsiaceae bacterium]|jgi:acyl-[acyl-carrier-protein]-phospholipid O-acyltransferase/long-chain-fatty-acid--[acyl-carrier-protein] ligase|nr:AMP-dependent synthetase and ligase [Rickettsiaceae bacterium]